ncbi:MAG: hypothetical protein M1829_001190 [Trizodia sp. TS-e1964]|nr:MAG: hypothetical protein M1829_001190 [Trizodia sp. TS-e1964]
MTSNEKASPISNDKRHRWFVFSEKTMEDDPEAAHDPKPVDIRGSAANRTGWRSLFSFTSKSHTLVLGLSAFFSVTSGILIPITSIFLGYIFNAFTEFGAGNTDAVVLTSTVSANCIALVALGAAGWLFNGAYFMFWLVFGELQAKSVRDKLFKGLVNKEMAWFDMRKKGITSLLPRMQTQIRELQIATSQPLGFLVQNSITAIAALGIAFYFCWNLTLVILATFPLAAVILSFISARMQPSIDAQAECLSSASKVFGTAIASIDTVKTFNGQDHELWLYGQSVKKAARFYLIQARSNALQIGFLRLVTLGMFVQGFWYGSTLVAQQSKIAGQILTTFWACLLATQAVEQILPHMIVLEKGKAAGASLRAKVLQMERGRMVTHMSGGLWPSTCNGDIEIKNASFAYPTRLDRLALRNASFFFPARETTVVIGQSGSGKSTLGSLLLRLYTPTSGDIYIDGHPIQTLDLNWLRRNITLVQQRSVLFDETLARNISLGHHAFEQVTMEQVKSACQVAMLQQTVNDLPDGFETRVGPGGNSLSGGQRQRVALARAKIRDSPILILDESTSALDCISRSLVLEAVREWRKGRTTIIITHDISQISKNDYLYVLDKGGIVQEGYREALEISPSGPFSSFLPPATSPKLGPPDEQLPPLERNSGISMQRSTKSVDSLDVQFPENVHYLPGALASGPFPIHSLPRSRLSQLHALDMPPPSTTAPAYLPAFPASSVPSTPPDTELIELSGRATQINRGSLNDARRPRLPEASIPPNAPHRLKSLKKKLAFQKTTENKGNPPPDVFSLKDILSTVWLHLGIGEKMILVIGFVFAFVHAASTPAFSYLFAKLLSTFYIQGEDRSHEALKWSLSVLGVAIGDTIASYLMHYLLECSGQAWVDSLRIKAFGRILHQPKSWFDKEGNDSSHLGECLDRNAEEMRNLVGRFAGFVFVAVSMMSIAIAWSFAVCWKLTLVGLASAPFMYAMTRAFEFVSGKWEGKSNEAGSVASSIFAETFTNIASVRALTLEKYFQDKHTAAILQAFRVGLRRSTYAGIFFGISDSGILFVTALIFYYGSRLASEGSYSAEDILTVFTMLLFSIANVNAIIGFIPQINSSRETATRLLKLASMATDTHERRGPEAAILATPFPITFTDVSFAYPSRPEQSILQGFSLSIKEGTSTAIVGSSGSGKSTVASLLLALYPPSAAGVGASGSAPQGIRLSGLSMSKVHTAWLRTQIAIVPQTPTLFPTSIGENICYGLPEDFFPNELSRHRAIFRAAHAAGIHNFIASLPDGYATLINDAGAGLSGGQAQRVAIARALIRRPRVLVLDEATASLDAENSRLVRDSLKRLVSAEKVALVVITHDVEMMRLCADVVVLALGRVVEQGGLDELLSAKGECWRLLGGQDMK